MSGAASSTATTSRVMRVYNRRPKTTRDWASLPPSLLENVFRSLEVSDLQSARGTCRKWKAQVNNQGAVPRGGGAYPAPAADIVEVQALAEPWMDTIEAILQHLKDVQVHPVDIDVMMQFLLQEGIIEAP